MHIALRADASLQIGTGHIMRCLTLADALREKGAKCSFLCRPHTGHLLSHIEKRGHSAIALEPDDDDFLAPENPAHAQWLGCSWGTDARQTRAVLSTLKPDWLIVDHYALDYRWEQAQQSMAKHIMVIDDLADRPHNCDVLLDQNLGRRHEDYLGLLNSSTKTFIGPGYALLRPEFALWREYSLLRREQPQLRHLLITMGGVDKDNATGKVLQALRNCDLPKSLRITIVMGSTAPWLAQVQEQASAMPHPTQIMIGVNNMAELMAKSDLAIGAAGSTNWERCCLGLPCLLLVLAPNQLSSAQALTRALAAHVLTLESLSSDLPTHIQAIQAEGRLKALSAAAQTITNGNGVEELVKFLLSYPK